MAISSKEKIDDIRQRSPKRKNGFVDRHWIRWVQNIQELIPMWLANPRSICWRATRPLYHRNVRWQIGTKINWPVSRSKNAKVKKLNCLSPTEFSWSREVRTFRSTFASLPAMPLLAQRLRGRDTSATSTVAVNVTSYPPKLDTIISFLVLLVICEQTCLSHID